MNGSWFPWGVGANGNTAARLRRHVASRPRHLHQRRRDQRQLGLVPEHRFDNQLAPLSGLYPGDAYVDWTCLDGYNGNNPWTSFHNLFMPTYARITGTIAPSKPMIVGETGSTESGGSKAQWITNMLSDLPVSFPNIHGLALVRRHDQGPGRLQRLADRDL